VSCVADPVGHIDEFRIAHVQRSDGCIETTWNNMSAPGAFAVAGAEEQEGGEPPPLTGAGVVVCLRALWCEGAVVNRSRTNPIAGTASGRWMIYHWALAVLRHSEA
jgi:hypothetical protein